MPDFVLKTVMQPVGFHLANTVQSAAFTLPIPLAVVPPQQSGLVDDFDNWLVDDDGKTLAQ